MNTTISREEFHMRALEGQYMEDVRQKNRTIAALQTEIQELRQRLNEEENTVEAEGG